MRSIANTSSFLQSRAAADVRAADDPETRLLASLDKAGVVPLPDVPKLLGMTPEQAVPVISSLRARNVVEVLERPDLAGAKFLRRR